MNPIWSRSLAILAGVGITAAVVSEALGNVAALAFTSFALLLFYLRDKLSLYRLWNWVEGGQSAPLPPATGVWERLFAMLYKQTRAAHRHYDALTDALIRFRRAAQALPDGVITLDDENRIVWFNTQAGEHFGLQSPADSRQYIANLLRAPDFLAYLTQSAWEAPLVIRIRDSHNDVERAMERLTERVLSIQLVGYGDAQKLLLSRDVTKIEKFETMRRDFVSNVSHELKTPLTVLSGFLETIRELKLPPKQQEHYLKLMSEQAERMERLVSDLLTLSALESTTNLADERVEMKPLIARIEATAKQLSSGRHTLEFDVEEGLDLIGAESELASAFTNLVTNAIRYTPPGGRVSIVWSSANGRRRPPAAARIDSNPDAKPGASLGARSGAMSAVMSAANASTGAGHSAGTHATGAKFSVTDTGIGIPAQHLPRLTERFYRIDRGRSRESGGTGLGLAIVKHVLTRHQARLEIESTVGAGSRFSAVFPPQRVARAKTDDVESASLG